MYVCVTSDRLSVEEREKENRSLEIEYDISRAREIKSRNRIGNEFSKQKNGQLHT